MPLRILAGRFFSLERALTLARTDLADLMLSSTGRMSRPAFLGCAAVLAGLAAGYEYGLARGLGWRAGWVVYPLLLFPTACILSKRLHDRGRAGWWGFLIVWALVEAWPAPSSPLAWAAVLVLATVFVDLGLMPGQPQANRFGPARVPQRAAPIAR